MVELYLEETTKVYNPKQADMFWAQWIQYQLDNYKTVKEVVDHLNDGPNIDWWPNAAGSHFFLTDAKGNSATIALLNGKYTVLTNKEMPMPLLCNNQYPLIINDHSEVAEKVDSAGIHVGNNDVSPSTLRNQQFFKNKIIGYSIEYLTQLENEYTELSDYLGVSPIFSTNTKRDTVTEWGLDGLSKIRSLTSKPLVAIGNINISNANAIIKAGADTIAVVSAVCAAENPEKAAFTLKNEILK